MIITKGLFLMQNFKETKENIEKYVEELKKPVILTDDDEIY